MYDKSSSGISESNPVVKICWRKIRYFDSPKYQYFEHFFLKSVKTGAMFTTRNGVYGIIKYDITLFTSNLKQQINDVVIKFSFFDTTFWRYFSFVLSSIQPSSFVERSRGICPVQTYNSNKWHAIRYGPVQRFGRFVEGTDVRWWSPMGRIFFTTHSVCRGRVRGLKCRYLTRCL